MKVYVGKIGFSRCFLESLYLKGMYIIIGRTVYQLNYSQAQQSVYGIPVYNLKDRVSNGHYSTVTAKELNEIIGHKVFIEQ